MHFVLNEDVENVSVFSFRAYHRLGDYFAVMEKYPFFPIILCLLKVRNKSNGY